MKALPYRSLQVGLSGEAVDRYVDTWTVAITDITSAVRRNRDLLQAGDTRGPQRYCRSNVPTRYPPVPRDARRQPTEGDG